jgi:hypothetical protein
MSLISNFGIENEGLVEYVWIFRVKIERGNRQYLCERIN